MAENLDLRLYTAWVEVLGDMSTATVRKVQDAGFASSEAGRKAIADVIDERENAEGAS